MSKLLHSLIKLCDYKNSIHFNYGHDLQSIRIRSSSSGCLKWIQRYGDASAQFELVSVENAGAFVIQFGTAGGHDEEQDQEMYNGLYRNQLIKHMMAISKIKQTEPQECH
ncbi:MAG: hypothetical protein EZS28_032085 [Streblomastix strix]|uniref:Uncharacterized protein n=1 Tax=Streblomastix strix TaxID=222440 RepID=A0A5J4UPL7_9EUKA|nr:MAG: hypothetical protein EZS28_032085 [Streblomastix strix]